VKSIIFSGFFIYFILFPILNIDGIYKSTITVQNISPHINAIANPAHISSFNARVVNQATVVIVVKNIGLTLEFIDLQSKSTLNTQFFFLLSIYDSNNSIESFTHTQISQNIQSCDANENVSHNIQSKPKAHIISNGSDDNIISGYLKLLN